MVFLCLQDSQGAPCPLLPQQAAFLFHKIRFHSEVVQKWVFSTHCDTFYEQCFSASRLLQRIYMCIYQYAFLNIFIRLLGHFLQLHYGIHLCFPFEMTYRFNCALPTGISFYHSNSILSCNIVPQIVTFLGHYLAHEGNHWIYHCRLYQYGPALQNHLLSR